MTPLKHDIKTYIKEYRAFHDAKQRCNNNNHRRYAEWGGRNIQMRFTSFDDFMNCVGKAPTKNHSIDRINNNGHYETGNVRWATRSEQQHNTRRKGVRQVKAKGLITPTYQAYVHINGKFKQLYCGDSLEAAKKAREEFEITKKQS